VGQGVDGCSLPDDDRRRLDRMEAAPDHPAAQESQSEVAGAWVARDGSRALPIVYLYGKNLYLI